RRIDSVVEQDCWQDAVNVTRIGRLVKQTRVGGSSSVGAGAQCSLDDAQQLLAREWFPEYLTGAQQLGGAEQIVHPESAPSAGHQDERRRRSRSPDRAEN